MSGLFIRPNPFNDETTVALLEYCREHKGKLDKGHGRRIKEELKSRGIDVTASVIATLQLSKDVGSELDALTVTHGPIAIALANMYALIACLIESGVITQAQFFIELRKQVAAFKPAGDSDDV